MKNQIDENQQQNDFQQNDPQQNNHITVFIFYFLLCAISLYTSYSILELKFNFIDLSFMDLTSFLATIVLFCIIIKK